MFDPAIIAESVVSGLINGSMYGLIAVGLTLVFGVLHIINFAYGSLLMLAMYIVYFIVERTGIAPYALIPLLMAIMFLIGYALQLVVIRHDNHGRDTNTLLITLGVAMILDNLALYFWKSDTRQVQSDAANGIVEIGPMIFSQARVAACVGAWILFGALWLLIERTQLGRAMRAVAKEPFGARVVGIDVGRIYAMTMGVAAAWLGAAATLLLPVFYVNPLVGNVFALLAFTIVVLGGMGSIPGAMLGGLIIGVVESLGGFFLGEQLGQIGIFAIFIAILLFRPTGLFGRNA